MGPVGEIGQRRIHQNLEHDHERHPPASNRRDAHSRTETCCILLCSRPCASFLVLCRTSYGQKSGRKVLSSLCLQQTSFLLQCLLDRMLETSYKNSNWHDVNLLPQVYELQDKFQFDIGVLLMGHFHDTKCARKVRTSTASKDSCSVINQCQVYRGT